MGRATTTIFEPESVIKNVKKNITEAHSIIKSVKKNIEKEKDEEFELSVTMTGIESAERMFGFDKKDTEANDELKEKITEYINASIDVAADSLNKMPDAIARIENIRDNCNSLKMLIAKSIAEMKAAVKSLENETEKGGAL